ncbi:LTA synthase family protein [Desertivirga xinjiangensis]|uniref:LTA synthase family protein n=1 Tax=Desertivirga xinjiangensis TaxID=539206 RepID=UPI00210A720A|nr:alkaline phosphatase family protein [Pedobacter xinjiangensis]
MNKIKFALPPPFCQLGGLVVLYFLCRLLFVTVNVSEFSFSSVADSLQLYLYGLRFDLSAIFLTNIFYILCYLIPAPFVINRYYQLFLKTVFIGFNSFSLLLNCVDIAYFPYVHKRLSGDAILFVTGEKGDDFLKMLPRILAENWFICIFFAGIVFLLFKVYHLGRNKYPLLNPSFKVYAKASLVFILAAGVSILGIRGGFQKKPLNIIHASEMVEVQNMAIVLNTPFTLIKTFNKKTLHEADYFPASVLNDCDKGLHFPKANVVSTTKQNVVIIIVESLSQNYISFFNGKGKTPFLDSLFSNSLVFSNSFANAKQSIQGIPAVLSSIPSLQEDAFIFSHYSANKITSVANLLKREGYNSSFFHGGGNGTMGFDSYSKLSGFDAYYGRDEYDNDGDFDGNWGIWDEPFLKFMASKLSEMPQPFVSTVFTLNTHHPFTVPPQYTKRFRQEGHPILGCVQYADYALSEFFKQAKESKWYDNTLFIITADHTGPKLDDSGTDVLDDYRVPIVFFKPDGSLKGISEKIANQIDILPSAMHLLNYPHAYYSQGKDLFSDACANFAVNYNSGIYQYIDSTYCYQFDGQKMIVFYNWKNDSGFKKNLSTQKLSSEIKKSDAELKKFIQVFNGTMINNKMSLEISNKPSKKLATLDETK